jgi:lipoprotein NlpD
VAAVAPGVTRPRQRLRLQPLALGLLWVAVAVAGCAPAGRPPVIDRSPAFEPRPEIYVVRAGDTLYSIAWRYQLDYRSVARANAIREPYTIYVGQRIRLAAAPPPVASSAPPKPAAPSPSAPPTATAPRPVDPTGWRPPTEAAVHRGFGNGHRAVEYRLGAGDRVLAARGGEVVYAGNGLGGYRHLVIVKHDPQYLSAYSFDRALAVREGQALAAGTAIALSSGADRASRMRFEIRRNGDPVNPGLLIGR